MSSDLFFIFICFVLFSLVKLVLTMLYAVDDDDVRLENKERNRVLKRVQYFEGSLQEGDTSPPPNLPFSPALPRPLLSYLHH